MPLIHAGGGVLRFGASEELIELAEYLEAPVTTSMTGRGSIPEDDPLCLIPASSGTEALVAQTEADVVLLVGGRLGDLDMWGRPPLARGDLARQRFIQIDISADMIGLNRSVDIGIVGDARSTLRVLLEEIRKHTAKRESQEILTSTSRSRKVGWNSSRKCRSLTACRYILCV